MSKRSGGFSSAFPKGGTELVLLIPLMLYAADLGQKMKTSLIQFANGASLREPYSTLTAILLYEDNTNVSLINHNANILLVSGNSIEWSGLIEILNLCVCVVT